MRVCARRSMGLLAVRLRFGQRLGIDEYLEARWPIFLVHITGPNYDTTRLGSFW